MPFDDLKGQVAIVTDASSGIGRSIAIALGHAGVQVMIIFHKEEQEAKEVEQEIKQYSGSAKVFQADVSKEADVVEMFRAANIAFGGIDILVNNSGIQIDSP